MAVAFSFFHGVDVEKPYSSPTAMSTRLKYSPRKPDHGLIAPSSIERSSSEIDELGIDLEARAEPVALLARAVRRVEREVARRELLEREPAVRAREVLGEREDLGLVGLVLGDDLDLGDALGELAARSRASR